MLIGSLLVVGIPALLLISLCTIFANFVLVIIKAIIESVGDCIGKAIDNIGNDKKNK